MQFIKTAVYIPASEALALSPKPWWREAGGGWRDHMAQRGLDVGSKGHCCGSWDHGHSGYSNLVSARCHLTHDIYARNWRLTFYFVLISFLNFIIVKELLGIIVGTLYVRLCVCVTAVSILCVGKHFFLTSKNNFPLSYNFICQIILMLVFCLHKGGICHFCQSLGYITL